jgi:hypothetical protein
MQRGKDADGSPDYIPDFELARRGVIREDNWAEYEAKGFFVALGQVQEDDLVEELTWMQDVYGAEFVYTGDAWSYSEKRPLRHIPAIGIYVHPDGMANVPRWRAQHFPDTPADYGPDAS